jgi:hypothetical protein
LLISPSSLAPETIALHGTLFDAATQYVCISLSFRNDLLVADATISTSGGNK